MSLNKYELNIAPIKIAINLNTPCVAGCCGLKLII